MTKRMLCLLGLLLAGSGAVQAQDEASPPSDVLTFAPAKDNAWVTGEFLFGWTASVNFAPLVTTSPDGTDPEDAGVLDPLLPTTTLLGGRQSSGVLPGLRLGAGYIVDHEHGLGVEAGFTFLASNSSTFSFANDILARPYIDATNDDPASVLVGFPKVSTGIIDVESKVGDFYSLNLDITEKIWEEESGWRMDALFGYRFASFSDSLRIRQNIVSTLLPGTEINSIDSFGAKNTFNGLDLGLRTNYLWSDRLSLNVLTKVAVGNMHRTVDIRGRTKTTVGVSSEPNLGGVLALSSNIGEYRSNDLAVLPEAGANLVWNFRSNMNLRLGYSLIYLTKATRADNHIDFTVNPNLFPPKVEAATPARPGYQENHNDFWIQSLNLGVDVTF